MSQWFNNDKQNAQQWEPEQMLRTLIEHTTVGFLIHDGNGIFLDANKVVFERLGYSREEFLSKTVFDLEVGIDKQTLMNDVWPNIKDKETVEVHGSHRRKDGSIYPAVITITCLKTPEKNLFLAIYRDISESEQEKSQLEQLAMTDELTKVANRRYFIKELEFELSMMQRVRGKLSFLMLDIDFFKEINDSYGHHAGDTVLQVFAKTIKKELRERDLLARVGGGRVCNFVT